MSEEAKTPEPTTPAPEAPPPKPDAGEGAAMLRAIAEREKAEREARNGGKKDRLLELALEEPDRFAALVGKAPQKQTPPKPDDRLESLERMMREREEREKHQAREAELHQARTKVEQFVRERSDDFPFVTAFELETVVFDRMRLAQEQGQTLSEVQAAREIEQSLASKLEKVAQIKALREKILETQQSEASTVPKTRQRTLTNEHTASAPTRPDTDLESMDEALAEMERMLLKAVR